MQIPNPATAGSANDNAKEKGKKERQVRRAKEKKIEALMATVIGDRHAPKYHRNILLLRSNHSRQHSKVLYRWGSGEEERQENTEK